MKRIIYFFIVFFCFINFGFASFQNESVSGAEIKEEKPPISHLQDKNRTKYIYYYGAGCGHCMELDSYFKKTGAYGKLDILKKETWNNEKNRDEMLEVMKRLGIDSEKVLVPFLLVQEKGKETYFVGVNKIEEYFKPILGKNGMNKKALAIVLLAILALVLPIIFINLLSKKQK